MNSRLATRLGTGPATASGVAAIRMASHAPAVSRFPRLQPQRRAYAPADGMPPPAAGNGSTLGNPGQRRSRGPGIAPSRPWKLSRHSGPAPPLPISSSPACPACDFRMIAINHTPFEAILAHGFGPPGSRGSGQPFRFYEARSISCPVPGHLRSTRAVIVWVDLPAGRAQGYEFPPMGAALFSATASTSRSPRALSPEPSLAPSRLLELGGRGSSGHSQAVQLTCTLIACWSRTHMIDHFRRHIV